MNCRWLTLLALATGLVGTLALTPGQASAQSAPEAAAARARAAEEAYTSVRVGFIADAARPEDLYVWSLRWLEASRAVNPAADQEALRAHLERMHWLEHEVASRVASGALDDSATAQVAYYVAEALFWMAQAGYSP